MKDMGHAIGVCWLNYEGADASDESVSTALQFLSTCTADGMQPPSPLTHCQKDISFMKFLI